MKTWVLESKLPLNKLMWKIRFTPPFAGKWDFKIVLHNPAGVKEYNEYADKKFQFESYKSDNTNRYIKAKGKQFYFDSGVLFYPFGLSLGWVLPDDKNKFTGYFNKFKENGINFTRIWNTEWGLILKWGKPRALGLADIHKKMHSNLMR